MSEFMIPSSNANAFPAYLQDINAEEPGKQRLRDELNEQIAELLQRLLCWHDEDIVTEALSSTWLTWLQWIEDGRAVQMSAEHRRATLIRAANNNVKNVYRCRRRGILANAVALPPNLAAEARADFAQVSADRAEGDLDLLLEFLAELPDDDRCLLELRFWDGTSYPDLAELLGRTKGAARDRVHRLLGELRARFELRRLSPLDNRISENR